MSESEEKEKLFTLVQIYLKQCNLIIWGSGATVPFGMPTMDSLKQELGITSEKNLEEILSACNDNERKKYEKNIFRIINEKDKKVHKEFSNNLLIEPIQRLIEFFYSSHPNLLHIITTNYDCILEYILAYYNFPFSDGYSGREFSKFKSKNFKSKECINLYKVHGSLRWHDNKFSHYNDMMDAIFPNIHKYEQAFNDPFRTLIHKSDDAISSSNSFLAIGFGFNDTHLTPKIVSAIEERKKIVVVTKKATDACKNMLDKASDYVLIEEGKKEQKTCFTYKEKGRKRKSSLTGSYWNIQEFNNIFNNEGIKTNE